ncbi:MAG: AAA family ATPase [Bacteroidales bacterium]|nr:AAA family ATPase [Bacteroidales bacterium]MBR1699947.1 AAA family ATPase [Bacteroidales bacterium]
MLYPIGIQDFVKIRKDGYVYVDKTDLVYKMVRQGGYYFLSRPRRFGKSLLVSTLEAYFSGRKELFDGLAIAELEKEWNQYPVLRLDFSGANYNSEQVLESKLNSFLTFYEEIYASVSSEPVASVRFDALIQAAYAKTGKPVVVLIDEYDKPIVDNLGDDALADTFRKQLQGFYSVMKAKDAYIKFGFLTGVTKIGKLSIFSGLNNLKDISMDARYTDICGISEQGLKKYFDESVKELAKANGISVEKCYEQLAGMYDGYHFCEDSDGMYNPFSVLNTFDFLKFKEYWVETGTPSFLVKVMKQTDYDVTRLSSEEADSTLLTSIDAVFFNPIPLLYQSGYLTIKGYDKTTGIYTLGFPNLEVKHGFLSFLLDAYTTAKGSGNLLIRKMNNDLLIGKPEDFMKRMEAFFARQNYQIQGDAEKDFQYAMSIILQLLGENLIVHTEDATSEGRMDILVEAPGFIYIIEIKINDTPEAALQQIEGNGYARKFADDKRRIFKIGVRFSTETRCFNSWKIAE